ncbi:hypothetical protein Franean1_1311 [Parafrankia sp. EAN1pec]|nr:hypothetical protein Franean1_1311 [Frankia sp. EAN1pec]
MLVGALVLLWNSRLGGDVKRALPRFAVGLASVASLAANVLHSESSATARVIGAWPAVALFVGWELCLYMIKHKMPARGTATDRRPDHLRATARPVTRPTTTGHGDRTAVTATGRTALGSADRPGPQGHDRSVDQDDRLSLPQATATGHPTGQDEQAGVGAERPAYGQEPTSDQATDRETDQDDQVTATATVRPVRRPDATCRATGRPAVTTATATRGCPGCGRDQADDRPCSERCRSRVRRRAKSSA